MSLSGWWIIPTRLPPCGVAGGYWRKAVGVLESPLVNLGNSLNSQLVWGRPSGRKMLAFGSSFNIMGCDLWFGVALGHVSRSTECLMRGPAGRRVPRPIQDKHEF